MLLLSTEWKEFVIFPKDPDRIRSREARFDLTQQSAGGRVVARELIVRPGDEFEAMRVDELGNVELWTRKTVWVLRREHGMEKLMYVNRHPYESRELT